MGKLAAHHSLHGKAGPHVKISVSLATSRGVLATREGQQGEMEVKKGLIKTWQITGNPVWSHIQLGIWQSANAYLEGAVARPVTSGPAVDDVNLFEEGKK